MIQHSYAHWFTHTQRCLMCFVSTKGWGAGEKQSNYRSSNVELPLRHEMRWSWTFISKVHAFILMRLYMKSINQDNRKFNVSKNTLSTVNIDANAVVLLSPFVFLRVKINSPRGSGRGSWEHFGSDKHQSCVCGGWPSSRQTQASSYMIFFWPER